MEHIAKKITKCPSCGYDGFDPGEQCVCGFNADESFITEAFIMKSRKPDNEGMKGKSLKNIVGQKNIESADENVIKEIDSWMFTFSREDNCITLGTPALKAFKLNLTQEDLEEMLEYLYKRTGQEKTLHKLSLSADTLPEVVEKVHRLIEDKRSRIPIKFDDGELQEIASMINEKLQE